MRKTLKILFWAVMLIGISANVAFLFTSYTFADSTSPAYNPNAGEYQSISPIQEPGGSGDVKTTDLPAYLQSIYKIGIGACFVLGVIMFTWAGIEYIITESVSGKSNAKSRIISALTGLAIALVSYLLLNTINPNLTTFVDIKSELK